MELPSKADLIKNKEKKGMRNSVSAEAYGTFNKKEDYKPRVIPKSESQRARILEKLNIAFMFQVLDDKDKGVVVDAMEEKQFS